MLQNWLRYWKSTLLYSDIRPIEISHNPFKVESYKDIDTIGKNLANELWLESGKGKSTSKIEILLCPAQSPLTVEMQQQKNESICLFWIPALIDREGRLSISMNWNNRPKTPFFIRDCLTPNPSNFYAIGSERNATKALEQEKFDTNSWSEYWEKCERVFKEVSEKSFEEFNSFSEKSVYVELMPLRNLSNNILKLYDFLTDKDELTNNHPLLNKLLCPQTEKQPYPDDHAVWFNTNHIGQFSGEFPLATSQRIALRAFTDSQTGDILAVNGPPGTGKTTLLQSVIANLAVQSVLNNEPPPLILASSTNNQAITNILNGFSLPEESDLLTSRWLPDVPSLGLYMSGQDKSNYLMHGLKEKNQTTGFFADYEKTPVHELEKSFLEKAANYLENKPKNITEAKSLLKNKVTYLCNKTREAIDNLALSDELTKHLAQLCTEYGGNCFSDADLSLKRLSEKTDTAITNYKTFLHEICLQRKNLPWFYKLMPFLAKAKDSRKTLFQRLAAQYSIADDLVTNWSDYPNICTKTNLKLTQLFCTKQELSDKRENLNRLNVECAKTIDGHAAFLTEWNSRFSDKLESLHKKTGGEYRNLSAVADLNIRLDISYRHQAFWLALHYREADYLEHLRNRQEKITKMKKNDSEFGSQAYKNNMQRFACLTPLFISTFHSAPKYSQYFDSKNAIKAKPYYALYDYLIIDEAGQVAPDIAVPTFSLAKTALVVGDTEQIEPVWSVTPEMDGVLYQYILKGDEECWNFHSAQGRLSSSGAIMKMAQNSCVYRKQSSNGIVMNGLLLTEHRRCRDSLISYSNEYVYKGSLKPMRGDTPSANLSFTKTSRCYIHIDYHSERFGKSYCNRLEAEAIAEWIHRHAQELCKKYGKNGEDNSLAEIMAVVTPYKPQVAAIKTALRKRNKDYAEITVGTVHALQGAERFVVLFSTVLSPGNPQYFLNRNYNMLNVAVSRAKDYFVLFGNMNMLRQTRNTPVGNLHAWLTENPDSELDNSFLYDFLGKQNNGNKKTFYYHNAFCEHINTSQRHDEILKAALTRCAAGKEIVIVSPFLSINAVSPLAQNFQDATSRNVKVIVYCDRRFTHEYGQWKPSAQKARDKLTEWKVIVREIHGIHSKTVIFENNEADYVLIEGSFNWLSAVRDSENNYHSYEASILLKGENISRKCRELKTMFQKMSINTTQ